MLFSIKKLQVEDLSVLDEIARIVSAGEFNLRKLVDLNLFSMQARWRLSYLRLSLAPIH